MPTNQRTPFILKRCMRNLLWAAEIFLRVIFQWKNILSVLIHFNPRYFQNQRASQVKIDVGDTPIDFDETLEGQRQFCLTMSLGHQHQNDVTKNKILSPTSKNLVDVKFFGPKKVTCEVQLVPFKAVTYISLRVRSHCWRLYVHVNCVTNINILSLTSINNKIHHLWEGIRNSEAGTKSVR